MLEILAYMTKVLTDLLFWMQNKEQDAAVRRIATINKVISIVSTISINFVNAKIDFNEI